MWKEYMIPLKGLKDGEHDYEYLINTSFFESFEYEAILGARLCVDIKIIRRETLCEIMFNIQGTVEVPCDRCLEPLEIDCNVNEQLLVKFGNGYEEITDELVVISEKEGTINVSQYIYEYVILSIPPFNKHKKKDCNPLMMEKLREHEVSIEEEKNPIWDELKDILKNN